MSNQVERILQASMVIYNKYITAIAHAAWILSTLAVIVSLAIIVSPVTISKWGFYTVVGIFGAGVLVGAFLDFEKKEIKKEQAKSTKPALRILNFGKPSKGSRPFNPPDNAA